eukprot:362306-Chlamydomonas_euryale.AAC.11
MEHEKGVMPNVATSVTFCPAEIGAIQRNRPGPLASSRGKPLDATRKPGPEPTMNPTVDPTVDPALVRPAVDPAFRIVRIRVPFSATNVID